MVFLYHLITYFLLVVVKGFVHTLSDNQPYNNETPRDSKHFGSSYRLSCAQLNMVEGYAMLLGALLVAIVLKVSESNIYSALFNYLALRIVYIFAYGYNCGLTRSVSYIAGCLTMSLLFLQAIFKVLV